VWKSVLKTKRRYENISKKPIDLSNGYVIILYQLENEPMNEVVAKVLASGNNHNFPNILWEVSQIMGIPVSDEFAENVRNSIFQVRWNVAKV
jgi:hypothetical protein